jgi:hypothetical protein
MEIPASIIKQIYENYINTCKIISPYPCIRRPTFPEIVSEHLVIFVLKLIGYKNIQWNVTKNDIKLGDKNIEVKCSSSTGPLSFGPTQSWSELYIIDATNFLVDKMICYKFLVSYEEFQMIKVNEKETFLDQCLQKRRPRISLEKILKQLPGKYEIIYNGSIEKLIDNSTKLIS